MITSLKKIDPNNTSQIGVLTITSIQNDITQDHMSIQISYEMNKKIIPKSCTNAWCFIGIMNKQKKPPRNWWFFVAYFMTITNTLNFLNNDQNYNFASNFFSNTHNQWFLDLKLFKKRINMGY